MTRAFSGRPARGLRNEFIMRYDTKAPLGYPAIHHLTSPIRKAAAAAGDFSHINLWAGSGFARATQEPVGEILRRLAGVQALRCNSTGPWWVGAGQDRDVRPWPRHPRGGEHLPS